jgi:hypothetical protein
MIHERGYELVGRFYPRSQKDTIHQLASFQQSGRWGRIDNSGTVVLQPGWENDTTNYKVTGVVIAPPVEERPERLQAVANPPQPKSNAALYFYEYKNGKTGTLGPNGKVGLPIIYDKLEMVTRDTVVVLLNGKYGVFTMSGKEVIPPDYSFIWPVNYERKLRTDIFIVQQNGRSAIINSKGKLVMPFLYDNVIWSYNSRNVFVVSRDKKYGLADVSGKPVTPLIYDRIEQFYQPTTKVTVGTTYPETRYGIIDLKGKEIVKPVYTELTRFTNTLWVFGVKNGYELKKGLLNSHTGKVFLEAKYWEVGTLRNNMARVKLAGVYPNKFGFIDSLGNEIIQPVYDELDEFHDKGIAKMKLDGKFGVINKLGVVIIEPVYDWLDISGSKKLVLVVKDKKAAALDFEGKPVLSTGYQFLENDLYPDILIFRKDGKKGVINKNGSLVLDAAYDNIRQVANGFVFISAKKSGLINITGKVVIPALYDKIIAPSTKYDRGIALAERDGKKYLVDHYQNEYLFPGGTSYEEID